MIKTTDLAYVLYAKANKEFDDLELELLGESKEEIIDRASEITDKTYILSFFESGMLLNAEQIMELLKLDNTLDACYEAWRAAKEYCPYKIKDVITEFADFLVEKSDEADDGGRNDENSYMLFYKRQA